MGTTELAPGAHVAVLRKARGWSQATLARRAAVSHSLLSKVEIGDRTLTPDVAAALGRALGLTMDQVLGRTPVGAADELRLAELRAAIRDYDLPRGQAVPAAAIRAQLTVADTHRDAVDVARLIVLLPGLLRQATSHAHAANTADGWMMLADVYSTVYWLAARHRWMDMAELSVTRQRWAVEQQPNPVGEAFAARDRAGAYLNFGDVDTGLVIVDRAVAAVQGAAARSAVSSTERDLAVGILALRGMTLAGRLPDKTTAAREAERHITAARNAAAVFAFVDVDAHGLTFGARNTLTHELATRVDLGQPRAALALTDDLAGALTGLPATRVAPTYINAARAQLDTGDRDAALTSLDIAFTAAPQMARIHPMGREVMRVIASLHKRSNSQLMRLSRLSGIDI